MAVRVDRGRQRIGQEVGQGGADVFDVGAAPMLICSFGDQASDGWKS